MPSLLFTPFPIMPNWCYNRITVYADEDSADKLAELKEIFEDPQPFNTLFPQPDWKNIPNKFGELPKLEQHKNPETGEVVWETYNFPDGKNDDRWYSWRLDNWDTKWEASEIEFECDDSEILTVTFDTAWSPPEGVMTKLREKFPDVSFQCFYDEPGCESAGYY